MLDSIINCISLCIAIGALIYSSISFLKKKIPMYYKLTIGAIGCFVLHHVSRIVLSLSGGSYIGNLDISALGIFGIFGFILSANYGQLDGIVDDKSLKNKKARMIAFIAPIVDLIILLLSFITIDENTNTFSRIVFIIILLPILPASYFCFKHLILPIDDFGFLKSSRVYNVVSLLTGVLCIIYLRILLLDNILIQSIAGLIMSIIMVGLVLSCRKGIKIWLALV